MIDSSGTVEPTGGFDLERARGLRDFLQDDCAEVGDIWGEMIAEIERLQGFETAARDLNNDLIRIAGERDELAARIQELEDALVEGLTNFLHYRASCYDPARRCPYAKECDDCSTWDACGHVEKFRSEARQLLQAEGKIGPDARPKCDHAWQAAIEERGYQTCLKCGECRNIEDIPTDCSCLADHRGAEGEG